MKTENLVNGYVLPNLFYKLIFLGEHSAGTGAGLVRRYRCWPNHQTIRIASLCDIHHRNKVSYLQYDQVFAGYGERNERNVGQNMASLFGTHTYSERHSSFCKIML